jgi:hypothetical protein
MECAARRLSEVADEGFDPVPPQPSDHASESADTVLAASLAPDRPGALSFARHVVAQVAPTRPGASDRVARTEAHLAHLLLSLLLDPGNPDHPASLRADPALLAAIFANIDLLFEHKDPAAAAISALVLEVAFARDG